MDSENVIYFCGSEFMGDCVDFFTVVNPGKVNKG
jgi:hypothetical protein